jgi:hypothetical protein
VAGRGGGIKHSPCSSPPARSVLCSGRGGAGGHRGEQGWISRGGGLRAAPGPVAWSRDARC